jgi:hypothetical protein
MSLCDGDGDGDVTAVDAIIFVYGVIDMMLMFSLI